MRVRYLPRAFAEREAIFAYLDQRSPKGARNVKRAIVHAIRLLADFPMLAPETQERGALRTLDPPLSLQSVLPRRKRRGLDRAHPRCTERTVEAMIALPHLLHVPAWFNRRRISLPALK